MTTIPGTALYKGQVWHKRFQPKQHAFRYPLYSLLIDLDAFEQQASLPWCLSLNRGNLFSLHEKDFGARDRSSVKTHILALVHDAGGGPVTRVMMHAMPRLLGFGFNPLTVYFCYNAAGELVALVYEVHNTFGESHRYVYCPELSTETTQTHSASKVFHVSPFFDVRGHYRFRTACDGKRLSVVIDYRDDSGAKALTACHKAEAMPLSAANLLRLFVQIPFVTFKVVAAIHYEAARLWLKRLRIFHKPAPPRRAYRLATAEPEKMR